MKSSETFLPANCRKKPFFFTFRKYAGVSLFSRLRISTILPSPLARIPTARGPP
jgi:hypothetical protein